MVKWNSLNRVRLFLIPWTIHSPWNSLGLYAGVGSLSLLLWIFPTQGSNPGLPHWRQILYQLSHQGTPTILEWVAYSEFIYIKCLVWTVSHGMFAVVLRARGRDYPPAPLGTQQRWPSGDQWFGQHWEGRPGLETIRPIEGNTHTLWEWSWGKWESLGARQLWEGGNSRAQRGQGQGSETLLLTQLHVCARTFSWASEGGLAPSAPTCDVPQTCYMFELWRGLMATLEFPPHCSQHSFLFQLPSFNHPSLGDQKTECHQLTWRALLWSKKKKKGVVLPFLHHLSTDNFEHRLVLDAVQTLVMQRDQETPGSCSDGIYILKGGRHNNI